MLRKASLAIKNKTKADMCNVYKTEDILTVTLTCSYNSELQSYMHVSLMICDKCCGNTANTSDSSWALYMFM